MSMLRDIAHADNGRLESTDSRVGVLASEILSGFDLPAFLLNDIDADKPSRLYAIKITGQPTAGELFLSKAGAGTFSGAPVGKYTGTQLIEKFDPGVGLVSRVEGSYELNVVDPTPVVTGVVITPDGATDSQKFTARVEGVNNPSQAVIWSKIGGGTLDDTGNFVAPERTSVVQVIAITAKSVANPLFSHTVNVVIPMLVIADVEDPTTPPVEVPIVPTEIENDVSVSSFVFSNGKFRNVPEKILTKLHVQDRRSQGTPGQTIRGGPSAASVRRELNTVLRNTIQGCSVYDTKITLPKGSYRISVDTADEIGQLKVVDVTNGKDLAFSPNKRMSIIAADFNIDGASADIEIHQLSKLGNGKTYTFMPSNSYMEIYLDVIIEKVK